jgi:tyrosine-protein phosphatase YwqE
VIDVHCHILPALDDGALDLDDSVAMAAQAVEDGVEVVCATPQLQRDDLWIAVYVRLWVRKQTRS